MEVCRQTPTPYTPPLPTLLIFELVEIARHSTLAKLAL
jgi:hypothetical protein